MDATIDLGRHSQDTALKRTDVFQEVFPRFISGCSTNFSLTVSLLGLLSAIILSPMATAEFPVAGGNAQRTGYVDVDGPETEPTVRWERPLGVEGISDTQPIIDQEGNIYATASPINFSTWSGQGTPQVVMVSFTPKGKERWRYRYTWDHTVPAFQGTWSQLSGPVIHGDTVLIAHRFGILRGVDRNSGAIRWEKDLSEGQEPVTSTPVIDRAGFAYIDCRNIPILHKINVTTGETAWTHPFVDGDTGNTSSPTLSVDEKTLYIGRTANSVPYLYAINTNDGTFKWAWSPESGDEHSFAWNVPILGPDGTLYIQDEQLAHLYAVKDLGRLHAHQWSQHREGYDAPRLGAISTLGFYSHYLEKTTEAMIVYSVDHSGTEQWTRRFETGNTGGMLLSKNGLYFGRNGTGTIEALDPKTGGLRWSNVVGTATASFSEGLTLSVQGTLYAGVSSTPSHPNEACLVALR